MPRMPRQKSSSGIYHVMIRGINRSQLFYDDEDYQTYLHLLQRYQADDAYECYAYCLMGNHVHLLIKEKTESIDTIFRKIGISFVYWYNMKYDRVGHLFQDRYKSEPVETDAYFLTVLRYIYQNPVKAGLCKKITDYPYSSVHETIKGIGDLTQPDKISQIIDRDALMDFLNQENSDQCLEINDEIKKRMTDTQAEKEILKWFGTLHPTLGKPSERENFSNCVRELYAKGISIRQFSRLTGVSKKIIENSLK